MPVQIQQIYPIDAAPALGQECHFRLSGAAFAAFEFFLEQDGILYPRPLPTEADGFVRVYPEASGAYVLHAAWSDVDGHRGRARASFSVGNLNLSHEPRQVRIDRQTALWVPTEWDARAIAAHERPVLAALQGLVHDGDVAYDVGANVGLFSTTLKRLVGANGWLYAFEPNPVCISFLHANLARTGAERFTILPVAVSDQRGECSFTVNYATSFVGATADSPATVRKPGHTIKVDADALDGIIAEWHLRPPTFIKMDIEGAEQVAIAGMTNTIASCRPTLLIELHGRAPAQRVLSRCDEHGYHYTVPMSGRAFRSAAELLEWMPDACVQVIAHPRPKRDA